MSRLRIAVATFGRSDLSILRPLASLLAASETFDAGWWAAGAHFDPVGGHTIDDVRAGDLAVWEELHPGTHERTPLATVDNMARHMQLFAGAAKRAEPDLVLVLGDRFEAVAAGLAMVPMGVPVGHLSGGCVTEGAIDDVFRHCLTKIAAIHFCDLPEFAVRLHRMGEPTSRIVTTGALGLDAFRDRPPHTFEEFRRQFGFDGLNPGYLIATLHPESRHPEFTTPMADAMFAAIDAAGCDVVVTYPNADPGADEIVLAIEAAAKRDRVFAVRSFGSDWYPTAMHHAGTMIGNSSGGIIEAASFGLPVVDIGDRQKGRACGANVIHCGRDVDSISVALAEALAVASSGGSIISNIYGDGFGAERVVEALQTADWQWLRSPKSFAEFDQSFIGERSVLQCA